LAVLFEMETEDNGDYDGDEKVDEAVEMEIED
jgi:hypothetical protein